MRVVTHLKQIRVRLAPPGALTVENRKGGAEVNSFDTAVQIFLTHDAFRSAAMNHLIRVIAGQLIFKGLVLIPILWWIWFRPSQRGEWERAMVIATIASGLLSLASGRRQTHFLPFLD